MGPSCPAHYSGLSHLWPFKRPFEFLGGQNCFLLGLASLLSYDHCNLGDMFPSRRGVLGLLIVSLPLYKRVCNCSYRKGSILVLGSIWWIYYRWAKYIRCLNVSSGQLKVLWYSSRQVQQFNWQYSAGITDRACLIFSSLSFRTFLVFTINGHPSSWATSSVNSGLH